MWYGGRDRIAVLRIWRGRSKLVEYAKSKGLRNCSADTRWMQEPLPMKRGGRDSHRKSTSLQKTR
jgi:hypothetical protein